MTDYNNTFPGATGSTVDASDLNTQYNNIVTSVLSKGNIADTAFTGVLTANGGEVWHNGNCPTTGAQWQYQVYASGLIVQWYWNWARFNDVLQTLDFRIPFPNEAFILLCGQNNPSAGAAGVFTGTILSNTQFQMNSQTPHEGCFWMAIGH